MGKLRVPCRRRGCRTAYPGIWCAHCRAFQVPARIRRPGKVAHEVALVSSPDGKIGGIILFILVLSSSRFCQQVVGKPICGELTVYAVVFDKFGRIGVDRSVLDVGVNPLSRISCTICICSAMCPVVPSARCWDVRVAEHAGWRLEAAGYAATSSIGSSCSRSALAKSCLRHRMSSR